MKKDITVSVVMPVYNSQDYIKEAIESVLGQIFRDFEFIIVDDHSTDGTVDIIKTYADDRIRLIFCEHNYINTLNTGIEACKGKYIARMDSDDIMTIDRLQIQVEFMEKRPEISICSGWAQCFGSTNNIIKVPQTHKEISNKLIYENSLIHPATMIRRKCFTPEIKYQNYLYAEDYKLWIDFMQNGFLFAGIPEIIHLYRHHENQITMKNYNEMMKNTSEIKFEYIQYIIESISKNNKEYSGLLTQVVEAANKKIISFESLTHILGNIHYDYINS